MGWNQRDIFAGGSPPATYDAGANWKIGKGVGYGHVQVGPDHPDRPQNNKFAPLP